MRNWNMKYLTSFCLLIAFCALLITCIPGCPQTPQAAIDQQEVLYGQTTGELNDLYEQGTISPKVWISTIKPARQETRKALDAAKASLKLGDPGWKIMLDAARQGLIDLQQYRAKPAAASTQHASIRPLKPIAATLGDPISLGIMAALGLMKALEQLTPIIGKLLRGEELTPEERAIQEAYSALQTTRAEKNDADATAKLG